VVQVKLSNISANKLATNLKTKSKVHTIWNNKNSE